MKPTIDRIADYRISDLIEWIDSRSYPQMTNINMQDCKRALKELQQRRAEDRQREPNLTA